MAKSVSHVSLKGGEKISLITNLSTMLSAGIPIIEAVDSLLEDTKGAQKKILETLRTDLMQGKRVYSSFASFPNCFDPVTVNLIKASEEAGTLETTLDDLRGHIQREMEFTDRIKSALIYPIIIMIVFVAMLMLILIFVVPKLATVFKRLQVALPLPTQIMIFISDMLLNHTLYVILGALVIGGLFSFLLKTQRQFFVNMLISLPLVNQLVKEIDLTRFSRSLYLLLSAGLPISTALELTHDVVMRKQTAAVILKSREMIMSGKRMSDAFKSDKKSIPIIVTKLIEAGEKSGSLDKSMKNISEFLDYQVSNSLKNITAILEPLMLLFVGLFVGGMVMAIISPIYGLIGQVGGR